MTPAGPLSVLIVDDEPLIRWALSQTLTRLVSRDCLVVEAADARTALETLAATGRIDVVVLDYRLPDCRDLSLLTAIRRDWPDCQVIVMTAFITPELASAALSLGANCVLSKPVELEELADHVLMAARAAATPPLA